MFGPIKNLIFDLDGTLVQSMPGAVEQFRLLISEQLGNYPGDEALYATLGKSPKEIFSIFMNEECTEKCLEKWNNFNQSLSSSQVPLFEGIEELFSYLKESEHYGVAVYTGRDRLGAEKIVSLHSCLKEILPFDRLRCGDDGFKAKPSGDAVKDLLYTQQWKPEETLFVGDHVHDCTAAKEAGVLFAAVLWDDFLVTGRSTRERFKNNWSRWDQSEVDLRLNSPINLLSWLKNDKSI